MDTYLATACGLHNPANLAPLVEITNPSTEVATFGQLGLVSLTAEASDFESGSITQIFWTSDLEGYAGIVTSGTTIPVCTDHPGQSDHYSICD